MKRMTQKGNTNKDKKSSKKNTKVKKRKSRAKPKKEIQNYHTLPGEIWKLVPGTDDYYVSNKNRFRKGAKLRKVTPDREGYLRCNIDGQTKRFHILVAMAFLPNPNNYPIVDHRDNDRSNCSPENLRWCTQQMNTQYAKDMKLGVNPDKTYIFALNEETLEGTLYRSQMAAASDLGVNPKRISRVVNNKENRAYGYKFFKVRNFKALIEDENNEIKNN